jgi:hypothetical protein
MSEKLPSELLESLPIRQTVFDGQLYRFRSPALAFYREWRGVPQVLVTEDVAVNAASYLVWEQYRLTDWVLNPITRFFPSRYRY